MCIGDRNRSLEKREHNARRGEPQDRRQNGRFEQALSACHAAV
jgi:hypothetical protein